jgi:hypothetical protein
VLPFLIKSNLVREGLCGNGWSRPSFPLRDHLSV